MTIVLLVSTANWLVITPPTIGKQSIVMSVSVCLCVCVFVCPRSHLRNCTFDLHQFLRMSPTAVARSFSGGGYVMYFRFHGWRHLYISQGCSTSPRSLGLGYKRRVGIHVAGNRRTGLLLAVGLGGSTGGRSLRSICAFSSPYPPESTQPKRHLDQFIRFCRAHVCVQETDRHTDRDAMTDRHTDRRTHRYTDTQTDHATSVAIGRILCCL